MAANLDRAETSLTAVSDVAYIRAIDSSGNSVRISKADLASVLGVIFMPTIQGILTGDLNDLAINSLYIYGAGSTAPNMPPNSNQSRTVVLTLAGKTNEGGSKVQVAFVINTAKLCTRSFSGAAWGQWNVS